MDFWSDFMTELPVVTNSTTDSPVGSGLITSTSRGGQLIQIDCYPYAKFDYQLPGVIICGICLLVGLIYCFFGYRFFKAVLFLTGFLLTSVVIYLTLERLQHFSVIINASIAVMAGILIGLVSMFVQCLGLLITGFTGGLFVGFILAAIWQSLSAPPSIWWVLGFLISIGSLMASISLKWQRTMIVGNTSFLGAALLAAAFDYILDRFAVVHRVWRAVDPGGSDGRISWSTLCWYGWLVVGLWPCLFALAALVQWNWTSVGRDHKQGWRACCRMQRRRRSLDPERCTTDHRQPVRLNCHKIGSINRNTTNNSVGTRQSSSYFYKPSDDEVSSSNRSVKTATLARHRRSSGDSTSRSASYESRPWRTIYQSRRAHGDVICQSYLESLQRLSSQTQLSPRWGSLHDTPTLSSDHTRLTALTSGSNKSLHCRDFGKSPSIM